MTNFGWRYPPGFNLALLYDPTHCEHDIPVADPCRKCDGEWDYAGCEHGYPDPVIHYDDQGDPVPHVTENRGHDDSFPNPNCPECRDEAEHNLQAYGTLRLPFH